MSEPLQGVVVTHGGVAQALVEAVKGITGDSGGLVAVTIIGCSPEALLDRLDTAVGTRRVLVFTDMPAGSCFQAALKEQRGRESLAVVTGVNLPMLLDFVYHRDLSPGEAAERAMSSGNRGIRSL